MSMAVHVGITVPQLVGDRSDRDREALRAVLDVADKLGFDSAWAAEMHGAPQLDPLVTLAFAAACTRRVRLGVGVLLPLLRAPLALAREVASIDRLSDGRVDLGVGFGADRTLPARYGVPTTDRAARYEAGLDLLDALLTNEQVSTAADSPWPMTDVRLQPRPVQRPRPPLWFGARGLAGIRRAVRCGDGWLGAATWPLAELSETVQAVRAELDRSRRDSATFHIGRKVSVAVDDDTAQARDNALAHWTRLGRPQLAEQATLSGPPDQVAERLAEIADLGLDLIVLDPVPHHAHDQVEQATLLAHEILPRLPDAPALRPAPTSGAHR